MNTPPNHNTADQSGADADKLRMQWLLRQIVDALPRNRDWLDPSLEKEAKFFGNATLESTQPALIEWLEKTEFIQSSSLPVKYLGWHRADVMRDMLESATKPEKLMSTNEYSPILEFNYESGYLHHHHANGECLPIDPSDIDSIALRAASLIIEQVNGPTLTGGCTQLKAAIQCIVIEAMKYHDLDNKSDRATPQPSAPAWQSNVRTTGAASDIEASDIEASDISLTTLPQASGDLDALWTFAEEVQWAHMSGNFNDVEQDMAITIALEKLENAGVSPNNGDPRPDYARKAIAAQTAHAAKVNAPDEVSK